MSAVGQALDARVHDGRKAKEHAGRRCDAEREEQHERVDRDLARPRQTRWIRADQRLHADAGEQHAEGAAGDRQQHAFGHELPEQPAAACAKRRAHREFTMTCLGAREQQVREIGAGDEQHETDGGLQHPDRAARAAERSRPAAAPSGGCGRRCRSQRDEHMARRPVTLA